MGGRKIKEYLAIDKRQPHAAVLGDLIRTAAFPGFSISVQKELQFILSLAGVQWKQRHVKLFQLKNKAIHIQISQSSWRNNTPCF